MPGDGGGGEVGTDVERGRAKKLRVAFHFALGRQTGWDCETCRKNGLPVQRRCGWLAEGRAAPVKVVWARGPVMTEACPRTEITAGSQAWLEMFAVWKRLGGGDLWTLAAKDAEAMAVLEEEWEKERQDVEQRRRNARE